MGNEMPSRRTCTNNNGPAATRISASVNTTCAAERDKVRRDHQIIRTLPRQNIRSIKHEIYNTKMMCALKKEGEPLAS